MNIIYYICAWECLYWYIGYKERSCQDIIIFANLSGNPSNFNMHCIGTNSCRDAKVMVSSNDDSVVLYGNSINCVNNYACFDASFVIIGLNEFKLDCNGNGACDLTAINMISLNPVQPNTAIYVNCYSGRDVCRELLVNGVSAKKVYVKCNVDDAKYECNSIHVRSSIYNLYINYVSQYTQLKILQVHCPLNPFRISNEYSIDNMDIDSCYIDLNNAGDNTEIYTIYGVPQTNVLNTNIDGDTEVFCDFDWYQERRYKFKSTTHMDTYCKDNTTIQTNIINKVANNEITLKLSDPNSNTISCDNNDCVIYISSQVNRISKISCPTGNYLCSVLWYVKIICTFRIFKK